VVAHQAVGKDEPAAALGGEGEDLEEVLAIGRVAEIAFRSLPRATTW
jgi:hypothetical protein